MSNFPAPDFNAVIEWERRDLECVQKIPFAERGELLRIACQDAEAMEASRLQMGLAPSQPAPWPDSTWKFLAEAAQHVRHE
jgi:hypothetical protein